MTKPKKKRAKRSTQPPERRFRLRPQRRETMDHQAYADALILLATRQAAEAEGKTFDPEIAYAHLKLARAQTNLPGKKKTD